MLQLKDVSIILGVPGRIIYTFIISCVCLSRTISRGESDVEVSVAGGAG